MRTSAVVSLIVAAACSKSADKPAPQPTPVPTPAPPPVAKPPAAAPADAVAQAPSPSALAVTLAGKPVTFTSAIATNTGDEVRIYLASYPYTCEDKISGSSSRSSTPDDVDSELRIGPYISADGVLGWAIRGSYLHRSEGGESKTTQTEKQDGGDAMAAGLDLAAVAAAGATTEVPLDYATGDDKVLTVKGAIKVTGCGPTKRPPDPAPTPLGDATMTIAGKTLPIGGAGLITKKDGTRALQLGTHPVKCVDGSDYTTTRSDVKLTLTFSKAGELTHLERGGYWVDWGVLQTGKIALSASPNRAPGGAKTVPIKLGGEAMMGKMSIALAGKVEAIVCATPK